MAAEKPAAKIRRNFFAFFFRTAAEKILFFYFSDIRDKLLKTQKVGISHYANIENKHQKNRKKLVATAQRRERIYKRTAEPSVTFCGEEEQRNGRLIFCEAK